VRLRPILFSAPMVRALLAGTKTQTRRIVKPQQPKLSTMKPYDLEMTSRDGSIVAFTMDQFIASRHNKYGLPGDSLWVRESWSHDAPDLDTCRAAYEDASGGIGYGPYYLATEVAPDTLRWKPSIHMPRWASRITLAITGVRVETLHSISDRDAWAEGIDQVDGELDDADICRAAKILQCSHEDARATYGALWAEINGWDSLVSNPWVWVVEFERIQQGAA